MSTKPQFAVKPQLEFRIFEDAPILGLGGPSGRFRLDRLRPVLRILLILGIAWLPLLLLSAWQHLALGASRQQSFLLDASVQVRFLIALPMILLAPESISGKLRTIVAHFVDAELVTGAERQSFLQNAAAVSKLRQSRTADICIVLFILCADLVGPLLLPRSMTASWHTVALGDERARSFAGWWFLFVSEPIYEFIFYRFLYRVGLWWFFLWKASRLKLQMYASHPDGAAGLGFLGLTLRSFKEPALALSTSFAAGLATIILRTNTKVSGYRWEIVAVVLVVTAIFAAPLFFFYGALVKLKTRETLDHWTLWQRQQRQFDTKWLQAPQQEADMLSVGDFSAATDLAQILERVRLIKVVPFGWKQLRPLLVAALLPFLVVLTLEFPVEQILKQVLEMGLKF
jgi:hypothetical protein